MADSDTETKTPPVKMTPEKARADAQNKAREVKFILNRIKASKAKRQARRSRPRVDGAGDK